MRPATRDQQQHNKTKNNKSKKSSAGRRRPQASFQLVGPTDEGWQDGKSGKPASPGLFIVCGIRRKNLLVILKKICRVFFEI
jgi:hypothetical protein